MLNASLFLLYTNFLLYRLSHLRVVDRNISNAIIYHGTMFRIKVEWLQGGARFHVTTLVV